MPTASCWCDEHGELIDGDQLMALIADRLAPGRRLVGGGVVATVMSNLGLERYLGALGLELQRTPVGDRYVRRAHARRRLQRRRRAVGPHHPHRLRHHRRRADRRAAGAGGVVKSRKPASEICRVFEAVPQLLRNVRFGDATAALAAAPW